MDVLKDTIMIIGIPHGYHDTLSKWASERNSKHPGQPVKAETIAEQAILEYVDRMDQIKANLKPIDESAEVALAELGHDAPDYSQIEGSLPTPDKVQE